ncbi:MAG TPA: EF-hand domain-containing protein [Kofleriaceae bacterium]
MKLALAAVLLVLGVSGAAHADDGPPPPQQPPAAAQRGQFRQLLLQRFDRNHDGRLEPRERRQAAKALHRLAAKLMRGDMRQQRQRKFIRRFDLDHDGNVGPGEMPPGLADEMRPLDRDGDGWLRGDELP